MKSGPRLPQLEKALAQKRRPNTAKNKLKKKKKKGENLWQKFLTWTAKACSRVHTQMEQLTPDQVDLKIALM